MPSKNSINRPKDKNTARAKAQHSAIKSRRTQQSDIIYGKIDSKKVQQKKIRKARLMSALDQHHENTDSKTPNRAAAEEDAEMRDEGADQAEEDSIVPAGGVVVDKADTRAKRMARKAAAAAAAALEETHNQSEKIFKMETSTGHGTTLGGPSQ